MQNPAASIRTISIDDFTGGRNSFDDQLEIGPNYCASGSNNVWAPNKALTKMAGITGNAINNVDTTAIVGLGNNSWIYNDDIVNTAYNLYYRLVNGGLHYPYASTGSNNNQRVAIIGYNVGTISISGGSRISATGNGTSWNSNVSANDVISIAGFEGSVPFTVSSVEDDTHLTLSSGPVSNVATGTAYTIGTVLSSAEIAAASLNGNIAMVTQADNLQIYDGTKITRNGAGPKAAFLAAHKGYLFGLRATTAQSRLYWSAINDPTIWPANNFVDIDKNNGFGSGLRSYGQELIVFKTRGMYKVLGDVFDPANPTYQIVRIETPNEFYFNSNWSAVSHIVPQRGGSFYGSPLTFYGGGHVYQYLHGTFSIRDISPAILRDLPKIGSALQTVGNSQEQGIIGFSFNGYYILKGMKDPNATSQPFAMIMDPSGAWWRLKNDNGAYSGDFTGSGKFAVIAPLGSRPSLLMAADYLSGSSNNIYKWDLVGPGYEPNFSGTTINATWISKEFNIKYGTFKWIAVYMAKQSAGSLTVSWSIDQGTYVDNTADMTTGRGQLIRWIRPINQKGSTIQIKLNNNVSGQTFKVYAITIAYEDSELERIA